MDNNFDNLKKLIERLRTIRIFQRLFGWKKVRNQLIDAVADLQKISINTDHLIGQNSELKSINSGITKDLELANSIVTTQISEIAHYKLTIQEQSGKLSSSFADLSSRDTTIESQKQRVHQLENSNALNAQRNEQLIKDITAASEELATLKEDLRKTKERKSELESTYELLFQKNEHILGENKRLSHLSATDKEGLNKITERKNQLEVEIEGLRNITLNLQTERNLLNQQNTQLLTEEEGRRKKYDSDVAALTSIRQQIQNERAIEIEARNEVEVERLKALKETWNRHQGAVKNVIKNICSKHIIEYVDKVSFKGDPDNTIVICEEHVVFDAKSPGSDDLSNFPSYLRDQAEKAKKYAKQDGVKKEIYFVVPTNTLERLTQFVFNLADYDVFIISVDSLEQIILSLKKIEGYEFADKLSPEERDNICRVLGKFTHLTKRRIQIDSFFAKQFLELAYKAEADLPKEFLDKVIEFEKSEKLNPPIERRAKAINIKELDSDTTKLKTEVSAKGILIDDTKISEGLNLLELYQNNEE